MFGAGDDACHSYTTFAVATPVRASIGEKSAGFGQWQYELDGDDRSGWPICRCVPTKLPTLNTNLNTNWLNPYARQTQKQMNKKL